MSNFRITWKPWRKDQAQPDNVVKYSEVKAADVYEAEAALREQELAADPDLQAVKVITLTKIGE